MLFSDLFKVQAILEKGIQTASGIEEDRLGSADGSSLRFLALITKVSALANTTKCYKFNHTPRTLDKTKLIVRYADVLQFLISIGNYHNFNIINREAIENTDNHDELAPLFLALHKDLVNLMDAVNQEAYIESLNLYIRVFARVMNLGECLGLSEEDMFGYYEKHLQAMKVS